jgi:hypothetical protein
MRTPEGSRVRVTALAIVTRRRTHSTDDWKRMGWCGL